MSGAARDDCTAAAIERHLCLTWTLSHGYLAGKDESFQQDRIIFGKGGHDEAEKLGDWGVGAFF